MSTGRLGAGDTAIQPTIFDAKGDLLTATAGDTPARIAVGSNGQYLKADSTASTGLAWATLPSSGKVLQVVSATTTTPTTIATTSQTDTSITATITPTLATSKVLVILSGTLRFQRASSFQAVGGDLLRGATVIADFGAEAVGEVQATGASYVENHTTFSINYLDNPATTSATTYKLQANIFQTTNSGTSTWQDGNAPSTITLLEIGV